MEQGPVSRIRALNDLLWQQLYLLAALNNVLDYIHGAAEDAVCEESGEMDLAEWLSQFDLYEKEYRDMLSVRHALLVKSMAIQERITEQLDAAGGPGPENHADNPLLTAEQAAGSLDEEDRRLIRDKIRRIETLSFRMTGATSSELVRDDALREGNPVLTEVELDGLDVDLGAEIVRNVVDNILDLSEEHGIPLPQHAREMSGQERTREGETPNAQL